MRNLLTIALAGIAATSFAGAAGAAEQATRTMKVPLADGSTVSIEYVGDVVPKVVVLPETRTQSLSRWMFPDFADFDRIFADMNRRQAELMQRMQSLSRRSPVAGGPGLNLAAAGDMPEGSTSVSVVTVANGGKSCTRITEVVSQGVGEAPRVTTKLRGDCALQAQAAPKPARLNHT